MDELQPQDIEDLLQELDEEYGAQETLPQEVEELLRVVQTGGRYPLSRKIAAEELGKVGTTSPRVVRTLIAVCESDPYPEVRRAAAKSLRAAVHQQYLRQRPDLMETTERALQQAPGRGETGRGMDRGERVGSVFLLGGVLASVAAYLAGASVSGYLIRFGSPTLSEYFEEVFGTYLCCGLPGLALSLFALLFVVSRARSAKRLAFIVTLTICAVLNLVVGFGVGLFWNLPRY